jgi:hypothetical protein
LGENTVYGETNRYMLARQAVVPSTTIQEVRVWIDDCIRYGTLLIINCHDIESDPQGGCTPEMLESILLYLNLRGVGDHDHNTGID